MVKRKLPRKRTAPKRIKRKKIVFIVIDGLADLPINSKTPLSEAKKTNLDWLAKNGICGEIIPIDKWVWDKEIVAGSFHAAISLLGNDLKKYYVRRGPIEAVGSDQPYEDGNLAIRCNFATVDRDLTVLDRRAGRNSFGLDNLSRYVNEHVNIGTDFIFRRTFEHRAVLIIKEKMSDQISGNDPYFVGQKVKRIQPLVPEAERAARLIQEFIDKSRGLIEFHLSNEQRIKNGISPANYILLRQAGNRLPALPNFLIKHKIKKAVAIAENGVMKGSCLLSGFDSITVPEMKFESYLKFIFDNIDDALPEYDFLFVHILGPDEPAHDGNFHRKREMIERIDEKLEKFKNFDGVLIITCDHITSTKSRMHAYGPVPVLIYGKGKKDNVKTFNEFSVKKGRLGVISSKKLWKIVLGK